MTSPSFPRPLVPAGSETTGAYREAERYRLLSLDRTGLLDSDEEERFDRLTQRAQTQFGVLASTVSLLAEDRQYLKSAVGSLPRNLPRDASICNLTIQGEEPLVVPDLLDDERFAQNPLVLGEPFIRFYAGVPLRGPGGWFVGTFCLLDTVPRTLDQRGRQQLGRLAEEAEIEINTVP